MKLPIKPWQMGLAGVAVVLVTVLALILWATTDEAPSNRPEGHADAAGDVGADGEPQAALKQAIHLYFIDADGRHLVAETRTVMRPVDPAAFGRQIVLALLEGPRGQKGRSLPEETDLRAFYLGEDGTAYVDFGDAVSRHHPGGVTLERLSIYSLVNSLVLNSDTIKAVRILIEGRAADTLAGHIDLQRSFNVNMLMIK
jgi:spore germination protein GerM